MALHQGRCTDINENFIFSKFFSIFKMILIGLFGVTLSGTYFHKFHTNKLYKKILVILGLGIVSLFSLFYTYRSLSSKNYNFLTNERLFIVVLILAPTIFSSIYFLFMGNKTSEKLISSFEKIRDSTEKLIIFLVAFTLCFKVDLSNQMARQAIYGKSAGFFESLSYEDILFVSVLCYYIMYTILTDTKVTKKYSFEILLAIMVFFIVKPELRFG